jgi:hypothetical protein
MIERKYPYRVGKRIFTAPNQSTEYKSVNQAKKANRGNFNMGGALKDLDLTNDNIKAFAKAGL